MQLGSKQMIAILDMTWYNLFKATEELKPRFPNGMVEQSIRPGAAILITDFINETIGHCFDCFDRENFFAVSLDTDVDRVY